MSYSDTKWHQVSGPDVFYRHTNGTQKRHPRGQSSLCENRRRRSPRRTTIKKLVLGVVVAASMFGAFGATQAPEAEAALNMTPTQICFLGQDHTVPAFIAPNFIRAGATLGACP